MYEKTSWHCLVLFDSGVRDFPDSAWNFRHRTESRIIGTFHDVSGRFVLCGFSEDAKSIAKTPGIGPKGAKRMIIELKDKLNLEDLESVSGAEEAAPQSSSTEGDSIADTVQALVALGYSNGEAYRAVHSVPEAEKLDAEQLLKEALKKVLTFL